MELEHDFTFRCNVCDRILEKDVDPYEGNGYSVKCCGGCMDRVYAPFKRINIGGGTYMRTKYSDSLAVSPRQIAEHKALFPHIPMDSVGRPGFENVKQQDKYLDACGFVKHCQSIKSTTKRGKTIAKLKKI